MNDSNISMMIVETNRQILLPGTSICDYSDNKQANPNGIYALKDVCEVGKLGNIY